MARQATKKQKKIAKLIIENAILDEPLNGGEMLAKVGYAASMQTAKVNDVLESEGVQSELKALGFTEENAKTVVTEIMLNKKADNSSRLKATDQVFKVEGSYAPEKSLNLNVEVVATPEIKELAKKLNDLYGGNGVASNGTQSSPLDNQAQDKK